MTRAIAERTITLAVMVALLASARPLAAQSRTLVMIDPGHGGEQAGVQVGDLLEKDLVLRAAFAFGEELVARGFDVRLTRSGDETLANADRRSAAETARAALMISLHFNQNADSSRQGIEIYGNLEDARVTRLANRLATELRRLETPVLIASRSNQFLTSPTVPTVMIEAGFLTHPMERERITSQGYHHELAAALVAGVTGYLSLEEGG
jgi:N-acetylmuramoyl-L-alanine amidase